MAPLTIALSRRVEAPVPEAALVAAARAGDERAIRAIIRRHNSRLFRAARAVLGDDGEAEDAVQAAYVTAFTRLSDYRAEAALGTWLVRIALNEALARRRRRRPSVDLDQLEAAPGGRGGQVVMFPGSLSTPDPEEEAGRRKVRLMLERAVDDLPEPFRLVFVLREVQGLTVAETAEHLNLRPETVKTRLFRARALLRRALERSLAPAFADIFPFDGARCANMADRVVDVLRKTTG